MTTGNLIFGVRLSVNDYKRIEIENCNFESTVGTLKEELTPKIGIDKQSIVFIYAGVVLEDDKRLSSCGIKPGVTIHVLPSPKPKPSVPKAQVSDSEISEAVSAFAAFMKLPNSRAALQKLARPETLQLIKSANPGLSDNPIALSLIQEWKLVIQLTDLSVAKEVAAQHPIIIPTLKFITRHLIDESNSSGNRAGTSSGFFYSLDALSDEDNEVEGGEDLTQAASQPREGNPLTRNTSYGAITAAQLADAILNSTQNVGFGTTGPSRANVITNEMFSNAILQAFATSSPHRHATAAGGAASEESQASLTGRLQPQLRQMREMGLTDEAVNVRALQVTSGDVQAAVELVFNGVID